MGLSRRGLFFASQGLLQRRLCSITKHAHPTEVMPEARLNQWTRGRLMRLTRRALRFMRGMRRGGSLGPIGDTAL
jgi:hypothetical protein